MLLFPSSHDAAGSVLENPKPPTPLYPPPPTKTISTSTPPTSHIHRHSTAQPTHFPTPFLKPDITKPPLPTAPTKNQSLSAPGRVICRPQTLPNLPPRAHSAKQNKNPPHSRRLDSFATFQSIELRIFTQLEDLGETRGRSWISSSEGFNPPIGVTS